MEDCFSNINAFGASYERPKGYFRADFNPPDATISEFKSTKEPGPCLKCSGLHYKE